jgi:cyclopropane-fatty-acyl-phospholipid synthase
MGKLMFARFASRLLLSRLREGRIEILEGGRRRGFGPAGAPLAITLRVHDPAVFWRALLGGSRRLAEAYGAGAWDTDDLVGLVRIGAREMPRLDRWRRPVARARSLLSRIPRNTRAGARRHIAAHYDLGNDLFRLFLDETMTYSCAVFQRPSASLREAQEAKLERVCRKLELGPDDHVLEIGTGWGSFAMHAAGRFGCRVTTTTISQEQHDAATRRMREAGLDDRVTVLLEDYRDLRGRYDKLVSIEMIEAVGWQYFDVFFRRCGELLDPRGLMLLQAIVIDDRAYEIEKASRSFIKELIFPSGCLPSLEVISRCVARATSLRLLDLEDITAHYPETLRRWRENFVRLAGRAGELGYDLRFRRLWELYLAYSEGGFLERRIGDVQALLAGPAYRGPAPSRERTAAVVAGS